MLRLCVVLSLAWLAQETLPAPIAGGEEDGRLGAADRPAVALPNDQGTHFLDVKEEGAQQSFDLFYPQLPSLNIKEETSTSVPVIHLPAEHEDDLEKVAADALLEMFPQDLLENNKKVRPVDVKIIEHDGYIDYEIEFVELAEYYDEYNSDNLEIKSTATEKPSIEVLSAPELTFVDLLMEARKQHRKKENKTRESKTEEEVATSSTPDLSETVKSPIEEQKIVENPNKRRKEISGVISNNSNTEEP